MDSWRMSLPLLLLLLLLGVVADAQAPILTRAPSRLTSLRNSTFEFVVRNSFGGVDPCTRCAIQCKLDGSLFHDCSSRTDSFSGLENGDHSFEVSVVSPSSSNSAVYNWTIDFIPPTGSVTVEKEFTNALKTTLHILLSEPCPGNGGFKCPDTSNCDVASHGPGTILPSSLRVIKPNLEYTLSLDLDTQAESGRVIVALARDFCSDSAGNVFQRSDNSSVIVRFDRTPVAVNLWTGIKELQVVVNKETRTLQATNDANDLGIYLDFSRPIVNTSEEILSSLIPSSGVLEMTQRKSHGRRRFGFQLMNVSDYSVVSIQLQGGLQSRDGTLVSPSIPVSFLYDRVRPQVRLTAARVKTRRRNVGIWIHFSEPVFLFEATGINISAGRISKFSEASKNRYFVELLIPGDQAVSVFIPENQTRDIAGNRNSASNVLQLRHYSPPTFAVASSSFVTAGVLATFVASGLLSIASTSLGGAGAITSRTLSSIVSNPSGNLLGMVGHLQVFALTYYASADFPIEYSESVRSIQWLLPHANLPWTRQEAFVVHKLQLQSKSPFTLDSDQNRRKLGSNTSLYGPALNSADYTRFFQNQQGNQLGEKYTGWHDFGKNMFWLGVVGGALIIWHLLLLFFLKWRTESNLRGALCAPRFEFFILILALPCICQASAFVIRGGTSGGIAVGVLLLAVPAGFFLSVAIFLLIAVIWAALVQYKEYRSPSGNGACHRVVSSLLGSNHIGKWVRKEGLSSSFLPKYGILFENRKGPPRVVYVDEDYGSKWVDSEGKGIGRMKPVNSDEDSVDMSVSRAHKLLGAATVFYILVDIARRVALGILFGAVSPRDVSWPQLALALGFTLFQLLYLVSLKPYIRRGVQLVESISLLCEVGVFSIALGLLPQEERSSRRSSGVVMVALLLCSFMAQLVNEWYALMEKLLKLSGSQEPSFRGGMKMLGKGLVFPLLPQRKWPRFITPPQQPRIGLVPVVHLSPSPDFQRSKVLPSASPISFTETGGPTYDPGSPSLVDPRSLSLQHHSPASLSGRHPQQQGSFGRASRSASLDHAKKSGSRPSRSEANSSELRTLRELAKASFPGSKKDEGGGGGDGVATTSSLAQASRAPVVQSLEKLFVDEAMTMSVVGFDVEWSSDEEAGEAAAAVR